MNKQCFSFSIGFHKMISMELVRYVFLKTNAAMFTLVVVSTTSFGPSYSKSMSVMTCDDIFRPPKPGSVGNCSLFCGLHFLPGDSSEVALCRKNSSSPVPCIFDADCNERFAGSYCKRVHCVCETQPESSFSDLNVCVVSSHWKQPPPLTMFPWKTLLIVCGTLVLLGGCLMGLRWLSPLIRVWREERQRNITPQERGPATIEESNNTFTFIPCHRPYYRCYFQHGMSHLCRLSYQPCRSWSSQRRHQRNMRNSSARDGRDKPPSYDTVIQSIEPPPPYEDLQTLQQPNVECEDETKEFSNTAQQQSSSQVT